MSDLLKSFNSGLILAQKMSLLSSFIENCLCRKSKEKTKSFFPRLVIRYRNTFISPLEDKIIRACGLDFGVKCDFEVGVLQSH